MFAEEVSGFWMDGCISSVKRSMAVLILRIHLHTVGD